MKRKWLMLPIATGILAIALTGGAVFAQSDGDRESAKDRMAARVAQILGLETETVGDAINQAAMELRDERTKAHLDRLVKNGVITPEQADERQEWLDARPEGQFQRRGFRMFRGHGLGHQGFGDHESGESRFFQRGSGGLTLPELAPDVELEGTAY